MTAEEEGVRNESKWRVLVLFFLTCAAVGGSLALGYAFLPAIIWAIALKVATATPYKWLGSNIKNRTLSAVIALCLVTTIILLPTILLARELGQQFIHFGSWIQSGRAQDWLLDLFHRYPRVEDYLTRASGMVNVREASSSLGAFVVSRLRTFFTSSIGSITQLVLMLFTLFFLYRDEEEIGSYFRWLLPLKEGDTDRLVERMKDTITATVLGRLTIAVIQGCLGGIMFAILGVNNALIWSVLMAALGIIPSLGTFLVWGPVAAYLAVTDHWVKALVLAIWGGSVISTIDNFLYPTLVGSKLKLHTVPILFSMLGGVGLFGFTGLLLGPLIVAIADTLLKIWRPEMKDATF